MSTISSPPPAGRPAAGTAVSQPASVEAAKDRNDKDKRPGTRRGRDGARTGEREFSDDILLSVMRAFGGERGAIVDKKV